MVDVQYSAEPNDLDQPARDAAAERPGRPIKIRIPPLLLRASGDYVNWRGVAWIVGCQTAEEAIQVRQALEAFFARLAEFGVDAMINHLTGDRSEDLTEDPARE